MGSGYDHVERFDAIAVGSGLAGLAFALEFADRGRVCVLTKAETRDANTSYAQGGIAAAVGEADNWQLHEEDTLLAGAGLCDPDAVRFLVQQAPAAIEWLTRLGAKFDTGTLGEFELGLEGGHSRRRIVHFEDRTGWEIERAMIEAVRRHDSITVVEHAFATDLLLDGGRCVGAAVQVEQWGRAAFLAPATVLATGGCGQLYLHTTNPRVATADGIALALACGAEVRGMEFMQFHPTTLYHQQLRGFLITEAARGAGATLRNHHGRRFMFDYDERLELAPRDVVARSIDAEMKDLDTWCVYLDMAHLASERIRAEFPTIYERLLAIGLEIDREWIPVVPGQHYACGGVVTDLRARTGVPGLYAAGEVASTGVHGANRLASNSLLEAVVFAREAAAAAAEGSGSPAEPPASPIRACIAETEAVNLRKKLQHLMTDKVGIVRTDQGLAEARRGVERLRKEYAARPDAGFSVYSAETWNLICAAGAVVQAAIARQENAGLHYNVDRTIPNTPAVERKREEAAPNRGGSDVE